MRKGPSYQLLRHAMACLESRQLKRRLGQEIILRETEELTAPIRWFWRDTTCTPQDRIEILATAIVRIRNSSLGRFDTRRQGQLTQCLDHRAVLSDTNVRSHCEFLVGTNACFVCQTTLRLRYSLKQTLQLPNSVNFLCLRQFESAHTALREIVNV